MKQIAFIGLGHMGAPMATNLLKAGYLLNVFDLVQSAVDGLVAAGASAARSARDAVQGADVVISMLPASQHVEGLYLDDDGLLAHIAPGTLTFMVGGDAEALEKARPLFEAMGRNIFHAGPDGAGQVAKVCNNQLLAVLMIGTAEAMALGVANGLEAKVLAEIMRRSSGGNWALEVYNPWPGVMENAPASRDYSGGFMAQLMAKDLGLAQEAAQASASSTPMGSLALSLYRLLLKQGYAERDFSVVQKLFDPTQGQ